MERRLAAAAPLLDGPGDDCRVVARLAAGDALLALDISRGWAWGYGPDGQVGYVRAEAVGG